MLLTMIPGRAGPDGIPPRGPKIASVSNAHAAAGTRGPRNNAARGANEIPKSRRLSAADGRRGCHERNCVSNEFISFIIYSFQSRFDLLQDVSIAARRRVGRSVQQRPDFLKRASIPDFKHDDLALF